jgi:UDP-N-acetylmuramyl pentapeptide phosphotransferase/UDP-N-acetylglucosamine-1-phosphate transferase
MIYLSSAIIFYFLNFIYIKIWKKISKKTPTGVGFFIIIPLLYFLFEFDLKLFYSISLILFSFIYFFDDLIGLNFLWRILIQILASVIIYFSFLDEFFFIQFFLIVSLFFILTNSLNFQDGKDLNICILLFMIFLAFYFFSSNLVIKNVSELILIYLLIFSIFNRKKNNLYFGDAGCFISSILIFLFIINDIENLLLVKVILSIIIFPILEIFLVNLYRIYKKENLLDRNYCYIYQILAKKIKYKLYLLPNIVFAFVNYFISKELSINMNVILFLIFINLFLTAILRFIISKFSDYHEN